MNANQDMEEEKWALLAKSIYDQDLKLTDEVKSSGVDELTAGSKGDEHTVLVAKKVDLYFQLKKYPEDIAWEKVQTMIQNKSESNPTIYRRLISNSFIRIAAATLVAALLSVGGYDLFTHRGSNGQMVEVSASTQLVKSVSLPDGTLVSLNALTHLNYPKQFGNHTREVSIEGEAFFEVKPDKNKPFIIHAGHAQIKVLGTSFNVNAYPEAKLMEVIVKTGKVQVINKAAESKQSNQLILNPGEKGTLILSNNELLKTSNKDLNFMAWKTHDLIFKATSLGEVIGLLEKVYKVNIQLNDPKLKELLLTAHFNNYPLDFILKVIEATFQLETQKIDNQYMLKSKPGLLKYETP